MAPTRREQRSPDLTRGLVAGSLNAAGLDDGAHDTAAQAWAAWEAAECWEDEHAIKPLADVRLLVSQALDAMRTWIELSEWSPQRSQSAGTRGSGW